MNNALNTAIDFLEAVSVEDGYRYFDHLSGFHWVSSVKDVEELGKRLIAFWDADRMGEIDRQFDDITEQHVLGDWAADTIARKDG